MLKVAFLVFAEGKMREDVYQARKPAGDREAARAAALLGREAELFRPVEGDIRDKEDLFRAVDAVRKSGVCACVIYIPTFLSAAAVAMAVRLLPVPCALLGNQAPDTFSQVGFLAACGAVEQAGLPYRRIAGEIGDPAVRAELMCFLRAVDAERRLAGMTYGMFGGRSLGISTGTADPAQWMKLFGVDMEQIDQLEIVRRAERADPALVRRYVDWVKAHYGALVYTKGRFEEYHLERMVRSYLAVKELAALYHLDFAGIKCQPELSNGYVLQCLTVQLLNDPYDAEGAKKPMACSCEADADGALTMQLMQLLSGGKPTALQDIYCYDDRTLVVANCGSSASYFSKLSDDPYANLKEVWLQPHGFGEAGGASTQFTFAPGIYTYARLFRVGLSYKMAIFRGEVEKLEREELHSYCWYRPTAKVKMSIDRKAFSEQYGCNHVHCVAGDIVEDLIEFCKLKGFDYLLFD